MKLDRWAQIEQLFHSVQAQPAEQEALLAKADPDLRQEVELLLAQSAAEILDSQLLAGSGRLPPGTHLGGYRIDSFLAAGGMGAVYKGTDTRLHRTVAIKVLPPNRFGSAVRRRRFIQEARAASALNHPGIVTVHDVGTTETGLDYFVQEFVCGITLEDVIGLRQLPIPEVLGYAIQIADALAAAHASGIIHRDLKPANIMLTDSGNTKLLDFGLAKLTDTVSLPLTETLMRQEIRQPTLSEVGMILGTPSYMSPEQARGETLDARTDLFSFGAVLYELLTNQRAFSANTPALILNAVLTQNPVGASSLNPKVPPRLEEIVSKALEKDRDLRYQGAADISSDLKRLKRDMESQKNVIVASSVPVKSVLTRFENRFWLRFSAAALCIGAVVTALALWRPFPRRDAPTDTVLSRLTSDTGLTIDPTLSHDGKLLAYASDRAGKGNLDIWVQQIGGGPPIRLTSSVSDDHEPSFSPDGTQIAFRSEAEPDGVYVMPALGGSPRLLGPQGHHPRFSPDGQWIAYWVGTQLGSVLSADEGIVFLVPTGGGRPKFVDTKMSASHPVWSADGKNLMVSSGSNSKARDWYVVPREGGSATAIGAFPALKSQGISLSYPAEIPWLGEWANGSLLFSAKLGDSINIWRMGISSKGWKAAASAQRLTTSSALDVYPSLGPDGRIVFASVVKRTNIWSLPIDANAGTVQGELHRLTDGAYSDDSPSLSADGQRLAFISNRSGQDEVWVKNLNTGAEVALTTSGSVTARLDISKDGTKVGYSTGTTTFINTIHIVPTNGGTPETVCTDCGWLMEWSADGAHLFYDKPLQEGFVLNQLDLATKTHRPFLASKGHSLFQLRYSPDNRWVAFQDVSNKGARVVIAPLKDGKPGPESEFIQITIPKSAGSWVDKPRWSPDGNRIYFISNRDGFRCIWSQRLNPVSKKPIGEAAALAHFHGARRSMLNVGWGQLELALGPDKMVFNLGEITGNIWSSKPR